MADSLEYPGPEGSPDWGLLYLYRADEVAEARPVFTGDVFFDVEVQGVGAVENKNVLVLQHPCALRTNGVDLADSLMVVDVAPGKLYSQAEWLGNYRVMPFWNYRHGLELLLKAAIRAAARCVRDNG